MSQRLGDLLVKEKIITPEQLEQATKAQKEQNSRLGSALVKLGFLTACLPNSSLEEIAEFAAAAGYESLEIAAWPALDNRPFTACHMTVDPMTFAEVDRGCSCLEGNGLRASSLAY